MEGRLTHLAVELNVADIVPDAYYAVEELAADEEESHMNDEGNQRHCSSMCSQS